LEFPPTKSFLYLKLLIFRNVYLSFLRRHLGPPELSPTSDDVGVAKETAATAKRASGPASPSEYADNTLDRWAVLASHPGLSSVVTVLTV